ncbi:MAG: OmpA family protein [Paludibacteraceae bacterium]|nr:OmpA family protein [Paludibacteraceae bacterium]
MAKHNVWMSVSDLMTGLMIIFLFIAVSYISKNQDNESVLREYIDAKRDLHDKLQRELKSSIEKNEIELSPDLSMKFTKAETCFEPGKYDIKPEFQKSLDEVMSKYFDLLLRDTLRANIKEIRIEGHTDDQQIKATNPLYQKDKFVSNAKLSQLRALEILKYLKESVANKYQGKDKEFLEYWLTACGMSYSRALDEDGQLVFNTGKTIDAEKSRRVEVRLITRGDEILENFVTKKLEK